MLMFFSSRFFLRTFLVRFIRSVRFVRCRSVRLLRFEWFIRFLGPVTQTNACQWARIVLALWWVFCFCFLRCFLLGFMMSLFRLLLLLLFQIVMHMNMLWNFLFRHLVLLPGHFQILDIDYSSLSKFFIISP